MQKQPLSPQTGRTLVLASTSPYRRELLGRLGLPFETASPGVDETPLPDETAAATSLRLAIAKASALAGNYPDALLIGSDQVALLDGQQLGKPGTHERAVAQLQAMRGREVEFHTALALHDSRSARIVTAVDVTRVTMRDYSDAQIERYLLRDQPYDCAGSAKVEALGIVMIARVASDDPTALIGLPLIALVGMLNDAGVEVV
ncbi:septum formation protein [Andreprevotia lacus DSM 23236]|jgi:septum formation protein|uniref:7-methyl-GTP pyrophosphatase n=1 Tax=Andreprevotia lacus DSM 23236 TaxID=1121001 RepID=A0A1W1Y099_9NEIS|nr:Maf family nucleotide pyrophosphatase [Andreprevotia lacus]SMC29211.1 septum formation protein [Andreprevotia lacus DSM 23236]